MSARLEAGAAAAAAILLAAWWSCGTCRVNACIAQRSIWLTYIGASRCSRMFPCCSTMLDGAETHAFTSTSIEGMNSCLELQRLHLRKRYLERQGACPAPACTNGLNAFWLISFRHRWVQFTAHRTLLTITPTGSKSKVELSPCAPVDNCTAVVGSWVLATHFHHIVIPMPNILSITS